jgi:DMSO/TMAO reductase YedYZ molybdopterin-dependent catalytic subunit
VARRAIGCAEWTGTPLRGVLEEAGLLDDAVEVLFTAHDRGVDQGVEQDDQRSLPVEEAMGEDVLLANTHPVDSSETRNQGGYGVNAVQRVPVRVM